MRATRRAAAVAMCAAAVAAPAPRGADAAQEPAAAEVTAAMTLVEIWGAQCALRARGAIDADRDGAGEFGTLRELLGACGVRDGTEPAAAGRVASSSFRERGRRADPPALSPQFGRLDDDGFLERFAYVFTVWLPDAAEPAAWTRGTGGGDAPALVGGSAAVGTDRAEAAWCAWGQPAVLGEAGRACVFVGPDGRVLRSETAVDGGEGRAEPPAALLSWLAARSSDRSPGPWTDPRGVAWRALGSDSVTTAGGGELMSSNETSAIATLRNLASCQAQVQTSGRIDCDGDGIGEHGTLLEMTGAAGLRGGGRAIRPRAPRVSDFAACGPPMSPPVLSAALSGVTRAGVVVRSGYVFQVFLPDSADPPGFTHETGPASRPGLAGGTGSVGIDASETTWCAYAQPLVRGVTGVRRFFVNQAGDILGSQNDAARAEGVGAPIRPDSAFAEGERSILGRPAVGVKGNDGDVWRQVN